MSSFDAEPTASKLIDFVRRSVTVSGFQHGVIALSGGVDSAVGYALAARALGVENVYPVLLPYGALSAQSVVDAYTVTATVGAPHDHITRIDIQPMVEQFLTLDAEMDQVRKGNIMARVRMIVMFDQARKRDALVIGTENKTEHLLGYYTRFGDEASDIEPLRGLYKTQLYQLARQLGVPEPVLTKAPTAELWEGQTDEGEFGFTYAQADAILALIVDQGKSIDAAIAEGRDRATVEAVAAWMHRNAFKHHLPLVADGPLTTD
jgi:NAD+ synthase